MTVDQSLKKAKKKILSDLNAILCGNPVSSMNSADEFLLRIIMMMIVVIQEALVERVNVLVSVLIRNSVDVLDRRLWRGRVLGRGDLLPAREARLL